MSVLIKHQPANQPMMC